MHAHSHRGEPGVHDPQRHQHPHLPRRAIAVGTVHGLAGSAALVLVALDKLASPLWGALYVLLFGVGSIVGMALLSVAISLPLHATAARLTLLNRGVQGIIALATIALGIKVLLQNVA